VAFEVVDADEGNALGVSERLGIGEAHEQTADKAGALSDGNGGEVFEAGLGLFERFPHDGNNGADVFAAGQFGHNAPIALVNFQL
jgi:hypothetical protein